MKLIELVKELDLEIKAGQEYIDKDVKSCYVSDLLSNVMGQTSEGTLWVTMQGHPNITAIASLLSLSAIVVAGGAAIEKETLSKAEENEVVVLSTAKPSFEVAGVLYELGLRGVCK